MKKIKSELERFVLNMPDELISKVEKIATSNGITMSWVYRSLLISLEKKYKNHFPDNFHKIRRPKKFQVHFRQTVICFYGDKHKWLSLARFWHLELGPLIRFGLALYFNDELELDFEAPETVKEVKKSIYNLSLRTKVKLANNRYIHQLQNYSDFYKKDEYWEKNSQANIALMNLGLSNRKKPLILSKKKF